MAQVSSPSPSPGSDPLTIVMQTPSADALSIINGLLVQAGTNTDPLSAYNVFSRTVYEMPSPSRPYGWFKVQQQRPESGVTKTAYEVAQGLFYTAWNAQVSDKEALSAAAYHNILFAAERIKEVFDRAETRRAAAPSPGADAPLLSAEGTSEGKALHVDEGEGEPEDKPINEIKQDLKANGHSAFSSMVKDVLASAISFIVGAAPATIFAFCAAAAFAAGAVSMGVIFSTGAFLGGVLCLGVLAYGAVSLTRTVLQRRAYEKASTPEEVVNTFDILAPKAQALFFAKAGTGFREHLLKKRPHDASLRQLDVFLKNMRAVPDDLKKKLFEDTKNRCPAPLFSELVEILRREDCVPRELS